MKRFLAPILAAVLCCGLFACAPGCSTANTVAYKTTITSQVTVETAMTIWGDYVRSKDGTGTPVSMDQRAKVKALYDRYQAAAVVVADAGIGYTQVAGTTNATGAQAILNTAIAIAGASLTDLVNAIRAFGAKI